MTGIVLAYDRSTFGLKDQDLLTSLIPHVDMVKIGLEALTAVPVGTVVNDFVRLHGGKTFQDWKLHDIGNTMANAAANLVGRTNAVTAHAAASLTALERTVAVTKGTLLTLLGVTVLTDIDHEECLDQFGVQPAEQVCRFAEKLIRAGFHGLVCSGQELEELGKRGLLKNLKTLVPGTRPSWALVDDQKRVMTYQEVAALGATWTVIGRVVMHAEDPLETLERVRAELVA
jgi:orotidine-5'-phosphate decarboxylase